MLNLIPSKSNPLEGKGRWYSFFLESDGSTATITETDLEDAEISGTYLVMPEDFHVCDVKYDLNPYEASAAFTLANGIHGYASGKQGVAIPAAANFDWVYVYVYGYFS